MIVGHAAGLPQELNKAFTRIMHIIQGTQNDQTASVKGLDRTKDLTTVL